MPKNPYYTDERAGVYINIARKFENLILELDAWQMGDVDGKISPIKHAIRDALTPQLEKLRQEAVRVHLLARNPPKE